MMASTIRKEIPSIPVFSSNVASTSDVPAPNMGQRVYTAAFSSSQELLTELEKVYLLGQSQKEVLSEAVEHAMTSRIVGAIENLFKVDVNKVRHLTEQDVSVNAVGPNVISRIIQGERSDVEVLTLFLDLGLDLRKVYRDEGDALMLAVRIGRWELIERILDQKGSFNADEVKYHKYGNHYTLLAVASDRMRMADDLYYGSHDNREIPIWADQRRVVLELLNRGASIKHTCLLPNLAADQLRKEQSVGFARTLIEEYGADVNERYEREAPFHRRYGREAISTALYEAVRNNFTSMVELLIEKGADKAVKGHEGMTLVECAWNNKHSGMIHLLRERGVPEGPETKGKDLSTLNSTTASRTPTPARAVSSDSSDDELDGEDRRMLMYGALRP